MTHDQFMQHLMQQYPHPFYQSFLAHLRGEAPPVTDEGGAAAGMPPSEKQEGVLSLLCAWHEEYDEEDDDDLLASFLFRRDEEGMREQVSDDDDDDPPTIGAVLAYCARLEQMLVDLSARLGEQTACVAQLREELDQRKTSTRHKEESS